ncbi:MAG: hypothetical protein ABI595_10040 [Actinomycetota bacterium]
MGGKVPVVAKLIELSRRPDGGHRRSEVRLSVRNQPIMPASKIRLVGVVEPMAVSNGAGEGIERGREL